MKSLAKEYPWLASHLKRAQVLLKGVETTTGEESFKRNLRIVGEVINSLPNPSEKEQREIAVAAVYYGIPGAKLNSVPQSVKPIVATTNRVRTMILNGKPEKEVLEELVLNRGAPLIETIAMADTIDNLEKEPEILKTPLAKYALNVHNVVARHGLYDAHKRLEEKSFRHLYPERYAELKKNLDDMRQLGWIQNAVGTGQSAVQDVLAQMNAKAKEAGYEVKAEVQGPEVKSIPSINYKLGEYRHSSDPRRKNAKYADDLPDVIRMRVILENNRPEEIYEFLSRLHEHGEIRTITDVEDRIGARRKPNGYESLHAVLNFKNPEAHPIELQIRTRKMHDVSESGKAAHYLYKEEKTCALPSGEMQARPVLPRALFDEIKAKLGLSEAQLGRKAVVLNEVRINGKQHSMCESPLVEAAVLHYGKNVSDMFPLAAKVNGKPAPLDRHVKAGDEIEFSRDRLKGKMVPIDVKTGLLPETQQLFDKNRLWERKGAKRKAVERRKR